MTENEHNYKGPTPICLVPRRLKCLVENATANDPEYRAIGHVNQRKGRWKTPIRSTRSRLPWRISLVPRSQNALGILGTRMVTNPPERACRGTR